MVPLACSTTGDEPEPIQTADVSEPEGDWAVIEHGPPALRRLTLRQFKNVIGDLLGPEVVIPELQEPDVRQGGLFSVGASTATLSARGVESLESISLNLAEQALDTDAQKAALVPCTPSGSVDTDCARTFITAFGRRAWRRPLTAEEADRLTGIADTAAGVLDSFYDGLELAIGAALQSPNFMFRQEHGAEPVDGTTNRALTSLEIATRLSFFLWNTAPDEELLQAADDGLLTTDQGLKAQAERLLSSDRSRAALRNFFSEYLELYELDRLSKDPTLFEHFSTELGADAREETLRLIESIVFEKQADFRDVMTTRETFLNPRLASLYGVPAPAAEGFHRVIHSDASQRVGLLGHASFLAHHSHAVGSSATLRGKAMRTLLLCHSIPNPPVNVDTSIPEPSGTTLTLRDRVAEHLEDDSCKGCHLLTDPIGLGLEQFDGIGRWRETDHGAIIDPSGDLDGAEFLEPEGLAWAIRQHPDFPKCVTQTLMRYATGRIESAAERKHIKVLASRFADEGYRLESFLVQAVLSPMFRHVGGKE